MRGGRSASEGGGDIYQVEAYEFQPCAVGRRGHAIVGYSEPRQNPEGGGLIEAGFYSPHLLLANRRRLIFGCGLSNRKVPAPLRLPTYTDGIIDSIKTAPHIGHFCLVAGNSTVGRVRAQVGGLFKQT